MHEVGQPDHELFSGLFDVCAGEFCVYALKGHFKGFFDQPGYGFLRDSIVFAGFPCYRVEILYDVVIDEVKNKEVFALYNHPRTHVFM